MKFKKIFSGLIAGVMAFSCVITGSDGVIENLFDSSFTAEAGYGNVSGYENFDMDCYVAGLMTDTDNPIYKTIDSTLTLDTPSRVLVNSIESDVGFMASMAAWEVLTFQPSDTTEAVISEIGYYETVILKTLKTSVETDYVKKLLDEEAAQNTQRLFSIYKNTMKLEYMIDGLDNVDFTKISPEKQSNLIDGFQKSFETAFPEITTASTFVDYFSIFVKEGKAIEESINNLCAYMACAGMSEYMKQVVSNLYANCDGILYPTMKQALLNVKTACDGYEMAFNAAMYDFSIKSFSIVYGEVVDSMFTSIIGSTALGCGILIGQAIGKNISNILFSTDATCEQYYKMRALCEFEDVLRTVTRIEMNRFKSVSSKDNANVMFSAVDMLYTEYDISCDLAIEYSDIVFTKNLASYFCNNSDKYNKFVASVENMRQMSNQSYEAIIKDGYIYYLEDDYPDIYEALIAQNEEAEKKANIIEVKSISFPVDSVEWGTEDTMLKYDSATISPSNATNSQIIYTSSDESVVSYHIWGAEVHNPGTAVITATSVSSGLTATLNVTVVEGQGKDGIYIEPTNPDEPEEKPEIGNKFTIGDLTYYVTADNEVKVYDCNEDATGTINIPKYVSYLGCSFKVTSIGDIAFAWWCENLIGIIIPDSVTRIGKEAFCGCENLVNITIPDSVMSIGEEAFSDTALLNKQEGPVYYVDRWLVDCNEDVTYIEIKEDTRGIADWALYNCRYLTELNIPDGVTSIGKSSLDVTHSLRMNLINKTFYKRSGEGDGHPCTLKFYELNSDYFNLEVNTAWLGTWYFEFLYKNYNNKTGNLHRLAYSYGDGYYYSPMEIEIEYDGEKLSLCITLDNGQQVVWGDFYETSFSEKYGGLKDITIPNSVINIDENALYGSYNLNSVLFKNAYCQIYDSENTINDTATIYGYTNSTAQAYAKKYNRKFISLEEVPETQQGDANGDGIISIADIVLIQKALVNSNIDTKPAMSVVDMNQDGKFNVFDLIIVRRVVLNT